MKPFEGTEAYKAGYEAGYKDGQGEWIEFEMPSEEDMYLVAWLPADRRCVYDHYYELLQWNGTGWDDAIDRTGKPMRIIAWRKLPDFYKEDE